MSDLALIAMSLIPVGIFLLVAGIIDAIVLIKYYKRHIK
jgi:hypothetical protein